MLDRDLLLCTSESIDIYSTIGTPLPTMKGECERSLVKKIFESDEPPLVVRQEERGHPFTNSWSGGARFTYSEPTDQSIDGILKARTQASKFVRQGLQATLQWSIEIPAAREGLLEQITEPNSRHVEAFLHQSYHAEAPVGGP